MAHFTESKNHFSRGAKATNYKQLLQTRMPNHKKNLEKPLLGTLQSQFKWCTCLPLVRRVTAVGTGG